MAKVQLKFDIDAKDLEIVSAKTLTLQQQIKVLKQELQKPGYTPAELEILASKLGETEDAFAATKARSGDLLTSLQLFPGPIGEIASKLNGAISLFKQFGTFKLSDLKFQLKETIDDVKEIGGTILRTTGLTKAWTLATGALTNMFRSLGVAQNAAAVASRALAAAIAATGIGLLVIGISTLISKIIDWTSNTEKAEEANNRLADSIKKTSQAIDDEIQNIKDQGEIRLLQAKKAGKSEDDLQKIREENLKKEIAGLEKSLSTKGRFAQQELDLVRNTNLTKKQVEERSQQLAEARNNANRQLINKRIELEKLQLQGEIDANSRKAASDKDLQRQKEANAVKAKELKDKQAREREKELAAIKALGQAVVNGLKEQRAEEERLLQAKRDFGKRVRDLMIATITDERIRRREEIKAAEQDELESFKRDENYIKASEEVKGNIRRAIREKYRIQLKNLEEGFDKEDETKAREKQKRELELLQFESQGLIQGTRAYYQNKLDIINQAQMIELSELDKAYEDGLIKDEEYQRRKTAIEKKGVEQRKDLKKQELAATGQAISATIDALGAVTGALAANLDEEAKTSKEAFEKRKKLQIATALMSAASGLVQILTQPSVLKSPLDWIVKGINAVALGIATKTNIDKIKATQFEGGGGAAPAQKPFSVVATRAAGGIVTGPGTSTSDSIPAMISNGEYVVNAKSTSAFLPLLTAINDYGRRPRFAMGGLAEPKTSESILSDNLTKAITTTFSDRPIKTYVVGQDMSNQQQFDRTIKSRSLL